ncbi:hypothetical protein PUN4_590015 [Paraburkholderia unamae]|nr:hypothetical protein PUN4_590015 [Paraburkholderia unamae]
MPDQCVPAGITVSHNTSTGGRSGCAVAEEKLDGMRAPGCEGMGRERATERHRDLPGFYPSVEPHRRLAGKVGDETGLLSDQASNTPHGLVHYADRNPSDPKMMQIASHLSPG